MTTRAIDLQGLADLRLRATARLTAACVQGALGSTSGALGVLHRLASSPDTAADALAMLHELQVHQVEVELQAEALSESRTELESALRRQTELYEALPVACFTVDRALVVHELNQAGAGMLGVGRDDAVGLALDHFLTPDCERVVRQVVTGFADGQAGVAPTVSLVPKHGTERRVRAHVGADPAGERFLLVLAEAGDVAADARR